MSVQRNDFRETRWLLKRPKLVSRDKGENDVVQKIIGVLGRWQLWVCFAIFLVKFPVAWHQLNIVFAAPPVTFTCADNATDKCSSECSEHVFDRSVFTETIITEWDLVCNRTHLANLSQTITMLGILFGNMIFGFLSDRFGRRSPLVGAVLLQVITGTLAAVVPWFWMFLVMRFLVALATGGTMVTSFVLIMELVGTKWRTAVGTLYQIPFNLGHFTLAVIAYFLRNWHHLQLAISIPSALLICYYWVIPESPRWLLATGRHEQAIEVLEKAAKHNRLPTENIKSDIADYMNVTDTSQTSGGNIWDLVRTYNMRMKTIAICFNWIVCGLCFFGVAQYIGQLGGNMFVNVAFSAAIQVPGTFISIWAMEKLGRRITLISANFIAGVSILLIAFVPDDPTWPKALLGCLGMFGLSICFPTVYIYSGELFPTVVRNIGVGTSSMSARLGSMSAPFVAGLVEVQHWLPPVIFGAVPLIGALLCYLNLPETLGLKLPDTIEEATQSGMQKLGAESKAPSNGLAKTNSNGHQEPVVVVSVQQLPVETGKISSS